MDVILKARKNESRLCSNSEAQSSRGHLYQGSFRSKLCEQETLLLGFPFEIVALK